MSVMPFCCVPAFVCGGCSDGGPANTIQIVLSGLTSSGCVDFSGKSYQITNGSLPNGTFCLTRVISSPTTCTWEATLASPIVVSEYSGSGCGGAPTTTYTMNKLRVVAQTSDGGVTYHLTVLIGQGIGLTADTVGLFAAFTDPTLGANPNCVSGTWSNALTSAGVFAFGPFVGTPGDNMVAAAFGGSATLTFGGC